jgi:hypothetical protein
MSTVTQAKNTIENTDNPIELKTITFGIDLFTQYIPGSFKNEQIQRSILADTIYFMIQCRLDKISDCRDLYTLEQLYFSLSIPKEFLG